MTSDLALHALAIWLLGNTVLVAVLLALYED